MEQNISYVPSKLPLYGSFDTVVVGGGTSGAVAAISAAREGLSVLVIEKNTCLGGSQTVGLISPIMYIGIEGSPISTIDKEIRARLNKLGVCAPTPDGSYSGHFNPIFLQSVLDDMVTEGGGKILYCTSVVDVIKENDRINYVVIYNNGGMQAVKGKCFIDATGDAELSRMCGVKYFGGNKDGLNQNVSLRFEMANVDVPAYEKHMDEICSAEGGRDAFMRDKFEKGYIREDDIHHFQTFGIPGKPNSVAFNCPELGRSNDAADPEYISDRLIAGRQAVMKLADFCKKFIHGFEKAYISQISGMLGVRESRRIEAEYMLTVDDVYNHRKFRDGIAATNYMLDAHGEKNYGKSEGTYVDIAPEEHYFELPFRCIIAKGIDNLFCIGRSAGTDFLAQSTTRIQHTCRYMGEAAGIGCRIAIESGKPFREVDGALVRKTMADYGCTILAKVYPDN